MFQAFWMETPSRVSRRTTPGLEMWATLNGPSHMSRVGPLPGRRLRALPSAEGPWSPRAPLASPLPLGIVLVFERPNGGRGRRKAGPSSGNMKQGSRL